MSFDWLTPVLLVLLLLVTVWIALRGGAPLRTLRDELHAAIRNDVQQLERNLRDEVARSAAATRQELTQTLATFQSTLLAQQGDVARTQNEQIDSFRTQLAATQQNLADTLRHTTLTLAQQALGAREAQEASLGRSAEQQANALQRFSETLNEQLRALAQSNDLRMTEVRVSVEQKLAAIQADNEKKLEQIRSTVDEKLHATLEQRLGESFKQVAERLEQVHRGLGEMQTLASDVGSLSRVLSNVKTRGSFGEWQLGSLLEDVFRPEQYARNVETIPGTGARVEFAVKMPIPRGQGGTLWLPIDAKFPREDYERLLAAQDAADKVAVAAAGRAIEQRLRLEARTIREKYVSPPHTTDYAILFVPTEGLFAEAMRRPGLMDELYRDCRVMLAGPTTLVAMLSSVRIGYRDMALAERSAEVWEKLGAVKTEFEKFGEVLAKTKKKLDEASQTIDLATVRTRAMARQLRDVESLPGESVQPLLPGTLLIDEPVADA